MLGVSQRVMIGQAGLGGGGGGDPAEIAVNAVNFDGTNDWLSRGDGLTGAADTKTFLMSWWFKIGGGDGSTLRWISAEGDLVTVTRSGTNHLAINLVSPSISTVWSVATTDTYVVSGATWNHVLIALNAAADIQQIYVNDVVPGLGAPTTSDDLVDFTRSDWANMGKVTTGGNKWDGDIAEYYMTNEFLDLSVESNRRKFISAGGKPVDMGSDGADPTGTPPLIFFSGPTVGWHTNKGSGGGFTENGALTDASSSPSD